MSPKHTYETTFIVNAALEDSTIEPIVNSMLEFLQNNGATISVADRWGRRRLAYPIQKKHNGYYVYVLYDAPKTLIPQLERFFQLEENILRHLTLIMTKPALEFRHKFLQARKDAASASAAEAAPQEESAA